MTQATADDHPASEELKHFLVGDLPEARLEKLAEHVGHCAVCQEALPSDAPCDPLIAALRGPLELEAHVHEPQCTEAIAFLEQNLRTRSRHGPAELAEKDSRPEELSTLTNCKGGEGQQEKAAADPVFGSLPHTFGRYQILRRLGKGGMGSVYLAQDTKLDRQVAVKIAHLPSPEDPEVVERFLREARAAARIQHEGICPVFDHGAVDGMQYISMAYIQGRPLSSLIRVGEPLEERCVATLIHKVALAMEAVHRQGILHRDLKPANILLDDQDQPKVVDFGLSFREQDPALTESGAMVGTPAYMTPEQLEGKPLKPTTDIYSLGVILYQLLTGRLPFPGPTASEYSYQIVHMVPERPSQHRAGLDPRLESICLKAMAKSSHDRHASMEELAADLQQYLMAAFAVPRPQGVESRPAAAVSSTHTRSSEAGGVAPQQKTAVRSVLADGGSVQVNVTHPAGTSGEVTVTVHKRQGKARGRRRWAIKITVAFALLIGAGVFLVNLYRPGVTKYHSDLVAMKRGPTESEPEIAAKDWEAARDSIQRATGHIQEDESTYRKVLQLKQELAADFPTVPQYRQELATSHNNLGLLLVKLGKQAKAEAAYRDALKVQAQLTRDFPAVPKYREELATSYNNLGNLLRDLGKPVEAEVAYRDALRIQTQLTQDSPTVPPYRQELAGSCNNLGNLLRDLGKRTEAESAYREALKLYAQLAQDFPAAAEYRQELATSHNNMGNLLEDSGRFQEAEDALRSALKLEQRLATDFPAVPGYRQNLARSYSKLGLLLHRTGHVQEAEAASREALKLQQQLATELATGGLNDYRVPFP